MKKKNLGGIAIMAATAVAAFNMNFVNEESAFVNMALGEVEAIAACESIGWWNNDGNCVKNTAGTYFCKSDDWHSFTDCKQ